MDRRTFISGITFGLLAAPLASEAQQAAKVWRIAIFDPGPPNLSQRPAWAASLQELGAAGYVLGQNLAVEFRQADRPEKLQAYAEELVSHGVDLIVTGGTPPTRAAKQATSTIPIVFYNVGDPVGSGFVANLSRPSGNLTGSLTSQQQSALSGYNCSRKRSRPPLGSVCSLGRAPPSH